MRQSSDTAQALLDLKNQAGTHHWNFSQASPLLLAILILTALLFLWAAYLRKPKPKNSIGEQSSNIILQNSPSKNLPRPKENQARRRNPTLAETGGLPPRKVKSNSPTSR